MKSILYLLFVVIILGGICIATCPDHDAHSEALKNLLNNVLTAELSKNMATEEDAGLVMLGSMIGTGIGGLVIDNILSVENYFVCSIGTITYGGETRIVSVGLLNHVFTIRDKQVLQAAEGMFN